VRFVPDIVKQPDIMTPVEQPDTVDPVEQPEILRLSGARKTLLALLLAGLSALFLAGTVRGDDTWWPFGPWRMFATSTAPSGAVVAMRIEVMAGDDAIWRPAPLSVRSVGLTRAEVEGRVPRITADPAMLGTLARSHARLRPGDPPWRAVRVVREETVLADGSPTGEIRSTTVASWP
jgi:hypothetical protein